MNLEYLETRMLAKLPIFVDNITIHSPKLIDIAEVGIKNYQEKVSSCIIDKKVLANPINNDIDDYDVFLMFLIQHNEFITDFLDSLYFFTKQKFEVVEQNNDLLFFCEEITLGRHNYKDFVNSIKIANCIEGVETGEELDEFDRRVLEAEKKLKEKENENAEHVPFKDLVSSVANMGDNNLNILNIWDLNIFTFYDQLKRGQKKEAYFIALKQLLAGVEPKDVKLEYYIQKLD